MASVTVSATAPPRAMNRDSCSCRGKRGNASAQQQHPHATGYVAEEQKHGKRIVRNQPDIPRIAHHSGRSADSEVPIRVHLHRLPSEDEDGSQMGNNEDPQICARCGLQRTKDVILDTDPLSEEGGPAGDLK